MRSRTLLVPVEYYHYSPHPVIIGIRRAVPTRLHDEATILHRIAAESPGWQTLAFAEQAPVGWTRRNALRVCATLDGPPAGTVPHDPVWNPAV